jgi:3-hydroxyisobutyrate dehydrogenase-like beta-hydroxyacid dehydrogenase
MNQTAEHSGGDRRTKTVSSIGFIGLGAMGSRIAGRLLDAGHRVYGTNRTAAKAQPLVERGLLWLGTPREVAASVDVVFSMVTDDQALEAIAAGEQGLLAGLQPGQVYVDMSTVSPQARRRLAERVRARGADMLDAPVSGSIPQVESGTLAIMVGGERHAFVAVEPVLRELGQTVTYIGPSGQGLLLKLAINISLAVQTLAFSEGLLLAERAGVDSEVAAAVMGASSIGSPMLNARIPLLLDLPEHAWFDVELMQKDIRLAREAADELHVPLPSATVADEILTTARDLGYAHRDLASLHDVLATTAAGLASVR